MCAGKRVLVFLIVFITCSAAVAQKSKSQLQKEKQQNLEKRDEAEKILSETTAKKKNTLGELSALNQRIRQQENLINSIKGEVRLLDTEIGENNDIIQALEEDLLKLKKEYSAMLFAAQKANNSTMRLTFLFSSGTFDQLIMRLHYMEQYSETRKLQAQQISKVQEELGGPEKIGYTTVLKLLQLMHQKGIVDRDEDFRPHVYRPAIPKEEMQGHLLRDFARKAFGGSPGRMVLRALETKALTPAEITEIQKMLKDFKK